MIIVKFLKPTRAGTIYNAGEIAGLPDEVAKALINTKAAVEITDVDKKTAPSAKSVG
jgi:hypothetical protein